MYIILLTSLNCMHAVEIMPVVKIKMKNFIVLLLDMLQKLKTLYNKTSSNGYDEDVPMLSLEKLKQNTGGLEGINFFM